MNAYRLLALACCSLVITTHLHGQSAAAMQQGVITVTGTAEMTKQPEIIRVQFKQYGKGNDQETAKAALVAAEKKLLTKLGEAGAEVIVANAGMSLPSQNLLNRYRNVSSMIQQRQMQLGGGLGGNGQPDKSHTMTCLERYLTIDLKPKSKTKEPLVLLADLQERLRKDYQELSGMTEALPKDENTDVNNNVYMYRNDSSMFTTDVRFQIAAKVTREDRVKLYGDAMKRARAIATDLAEAAEMKAGAIQNINSNFSTMNNVYNYGGVQRGMNGSGELAKFPFTLKEDGSETVAVRELNTNYQSGHQEPLTYGISLTASFKLEPGK
ncbi:MAG TPA: SIMPL domain-containing protein [Gemmatales bacterium]|nr:SIMPL domain-containing protein [Gemmatales bacterium]